MSPSLSNTRAFSYFLSIYQARTVKCIQQESRILSLNHHVDCFTSNSENDHMDRNQEAFGLAIENNKSGDREDIVNSFVSLLECRQERNSASFAIGTNYDLI